MRVRAVIDVYLGAGIGRGFKKAGTEFDYDGPPNQHLEPVVSENEPELELEPPAGVPLAKGVTRKKKAKKKRLPRALDG